MNAFVFVFGLIVTVVVTGAIGTIWWAAIRDGEDEAAVRRGEPTDRSAAPAGPTAGTSA